MSYATVRFMFLQRRFQPAVLCCFGKHLCQIARDALYYTYSSEFVAYHFCKKCYDVSDSEINLGDEVG